MLQKFIKNIQAKPEPVRRSITLGTSLGITGIVGFFWLVSFLNYSSEVLLAKPKTESPTSFLNKIGSLIGESYANVRTKMDDTKVFVGDADVETSSSSSDSEIIDTATSSPGGNAEITPTTPATTTNVDVKENSSNNVSLQDILTTKKKDNQENKATTSSEVLVQ